MKSKYKTGTKVKIINPEFFIRCGYPETIESARKKLEEEFLQKHGKSIKTILNNLVDFNNNPKSKIDGLKFIGNFFKEWEEDKIIDIIARAYNREVLGFGGCDRKVYTKRIPELEGKTMYIGEFERPLIKKSGKYIQGAGATCSYEGEYDYDPSYLDNVKTHTFYPVTDGSCVAWSCFIKSKGIDAYINWIEKTNFEIIEEEIS